MTPNSYNSDLEQPQQHKSCCNGCCLKALEEKVDHLQATIAQLLEAKQTIGDWISEEATMKLIGLSRTALWKLRQEKNLLGVPIAEKKKFYRKSSIERLLDENEILEKAKKII